MSIIEALRVQEGMGQLTQEIGNFMFDMLNTPLPAELQERFQYPKCPFCKGRPRLVEVRGAATLVQIRAGSPLAISIPKYRVESCCSSTYAKNEDGSLRQNEGLSRKQLFHLTKSAQHPSERGKVYRNQGKL